MTTKPNFVNYRLVQRIAFREFMAAREDGAKMFEKVEEMSVENCVRGLKHALCPFCRFVAYGENGGEIYRDEVIEELRDDGLVGPTQFMAALVKDTVLGKVGDGMLRRCIDSFRLGSDGVMEPSKLVPGYSEKTVDIMKKVFDAWMKYAGINWMETVDLVGHWTDDEAGDLLGVVGKILEGGYLAGFYHTAKHHELDESTLKALIECQLTVYAFDTPYGYPIYAVLPEHSCAVVNCCYIVEGNQTLLGVADKFASALTPVIQLYDEFAARLYASPELVRQKLCAPNTEIVVSDDLLDNIEPVKIFGMESEDAVSHDRSYESVPLDYTLTIYSPYDAVRDFVSTIPAGGHGAIEFFRETYVNIQLWNMIGNDLNLRLPIDLQHTIADFIARVKGYVMVEVTPMKELWYQMRWFGALARSRKISEQIVALPAGPVNSNFRFARIAYGLTSDVSFAFRQFYDDLRDKYLAFLAVYRRMSTSGCMVHVGYVESVQLMIVDLERFISGAMSFDQRMKAVQSLTRRVACMTIGTALFGNIDLTTTLTFNDVQVYTALDKNITWWLNVGNDAVSFIESTVRSIVIDRTRETGAPFLKGFCLLNMVKPQFWADILTLIGYCPVLDYRLAQILQVHANPDWFLPYASVTTYIGSNGHIHRYTPGSDMRVETPMMIIDRVANNSSD